MNTDSPSDSPSRPRKRAVCLTQQGVQELIDAIATTWTRDPRSGKLTRETRAELLGVSAATADRMLNRKGVDRSSITLAFKKMGVEWDESYCEAVTATTRESDPMGSVSTRPEEPRVIPNALTVRHKSKAWMNFAVASGLMATLILGWLLIARQAQNAVPPVTRGWVNDYNDYFQIGTETFHRGEFALAHQYLDKAISLARKNDSAGKLASAYRLRGDLVMAEGSFDIAIEQFRQAIKLREDLHQAESLPALYEALGDAQTRAGEFTAAKESLMKSLAGFTAYRQPVGMSMANRDLGSVAYETGDLVLAKKYFLLSLAQVRDQQKPDIEADVRARHALVLFRTGQPERAREQLKECLKHWQREGHGRWIATTKLQLGIVEAGAGYLSHAVTLLSDSLDGFRRVGDQAGAQNCARTLDKIRAGSAESRLTASLTTNHRLENHKQQNPRLSGGF